MVFTRVLLVRQQRPHALNCTDDESPGTPDLASTGHGQEHSIQIGEEDSQNSYIVHQNSYIVHPNSYIVHPFTLLCLNGGGYTKPT